jgi:hypothetical protein
MESRRSEFTQKSTSTSSGLGAPGALGAGGLGGAGMQSGFQQGGMMQQQQGGQVGSSMGYCEASGIDVGVSQKTTTTVLPPIEVTKVVPQIHLSGGAAVCGGGTVSAEAVTVPTEIAAAERSGSSVVAASMGTECVRSGGAVGAGAGGLGASGLGAGGFQQQSQQYSSTTTSSSTGSSAAGGLGARRL